MNESISMIGRNVMMMCGALIAIIKPTIPFIIICTIAVFMDCFTAWLLSRRVK